MPDSESEGGMVYQLVGTNDEGLNIYQLETTVKIRDETNMIQIVTIGKRNDKPTKTVLLIGQTGAGKSTLVNAIVNYLRQVKSDENSRFSIFDEVGCVPKSSAVSQTEYVTGYLFYHQPGMAHDCNFLFIDTPGLADTRGKHAQVRIRKQMEVFLQEPKFEVNELHCLAFVINGTTNRSHQYLREIIDDFKMLFGNDTNGIIKVLATHSDDSPPVAQVLRELNINANKVYTFDNGVLYRQCNGNTKMSRLSHIKWEILGDCYSEFFEDLIISTPVSLKLTREVISEKMDLERSLLMLKKHIDNRIHSLLENRSKMKMCKNYMRCMKNNEAFEGEETINVKKRMPIAGRLIHAHNCPTCEQTCVYPCTAVKSAFCSCPKGDITCEFCPCSNADHERENVVIMEVLETIKVTHATMKARYEVAKAKKLSMDQVMKDLEEMVDIQSNLIAVYVKRTVKHIERINQITLNPKVKPPEEYITAIIREIQGPLLRDITDSSEREFVINTLNVLPEQVRKVTLHENENQGLKTRLKKMLTKTLSSEMKRFSFI